MPKLLSPLTKEFKIRGILGVSDEDPIIVKFRQARERDVLLRQEMLSQRIERRWPADENIDTFAEVVDAINLSRRRAIEVFLTMVACNVEEEVPGHTEKPLEQRPYRPMFPSLSLNGTAQLNFKDFQTFERKWGELEPEWALAIHTACLITNPTWGVAIYDEDEVQEVLSEGEGVGADKPG